MIQTLTRFSLPLAALSLLYGCSALAPGWETPGTTWFAPSAPRATTPVVALPGPAPQDPCAEEAWRLSFQLPQDRAMVYHREYARCAGLLAAPGTSPAASPPAPRNGTPPLRAPQPARN